MRGRVAVWTLLLMTSVGSYLVLGEIVPGIGEYYFNGIPGNWTEAYRQCQASGGNLAVIDSKGEAEALLGIMRKFNATSIHLGFHDQFLEGDYVTLFGAAIEEDCTGASPWAPGNPSGSSLYNCGGFSADGFEDTRCEDENVYICELRESQAGGNSKGDYELLPGHGYYKYNTSFVRWSEAWAECRVDGANLLVINSEAEVTALYEKYQYPFIFLGVHRFFGGNDDFVTVLGEPLKSTGYANWSSIYPWGSFITHPLVATYKNEGLQTLMDRDKYNFICEL